MEASAQRGLTHEKERHWRRCGNMLPRGQFRLWQAKWAFFMLRSFPVLLAACSVHAPSRANAGVRPDSRVREAMEIGINRRGQNGRWPRNLLHCERIPLEMESAVGSASRWNTLPTFRVLR